MDAVWNINHVTHAWQKQQPLSALLMMPSAGDNQWGRPLICVFLFLNCPLEGTSVEFFIYIKKKTIEFQGHCKTTSMPQPFLCFWFIVLSNDSVLRKICPTADLTSGWKRCCHADLISTHSKSARFKSSHCHHCAWYLVWPFLVFCLFELFCSLLV